MYLPDGRGGSEPIARIPPSEWDNLIKLCTGNACEMAAAPGSGPLWREALTDLTILS